MRNPAAGLTLRRRLEALHGGRLHDAPGGLRATIDGLRIEIVFDDQALGEVLAWWKPGTALRVERLALLVNALNARDDGAPWSAQEREILLGLERAQHWTVGEPHRGRAQTGLRLAQLGFDRSYASPLAARATDGYPRLARLLRLGQALATATTEVANLD